MKANIKDKGKWGIYCIKNTVNQKVYVGKAIDIHRRIKQRYELHLEEREIIGQRSKEFWANNPDAKEQMRRSVAYKNRKFRIGQFNKQTDELIKIYEIIDDIKQEYPDFYLQAIKGCCQGTKASYKGYKWHYVELNSNQIRYKN